MSLEAEVPVIYGVASTLKILKELDEELYTQARKELLVAVKPLMDDVKRNIPEAGPYSTSGKPMKGFQHSGRTGWKNPVIVSRQVMVRKKQGKHSLVRITVKNANKGGAIGIADMAGRGSKGHTASGRALIANLSQNPSRYVYPAVMKNLGLIQTTLLNTIRRYSNDVNQEMMLIKEGWP